MKYYKHESEMLPPQYGYGSTYQEIDWDKDMIVRQVDVEGDVYRWGEWTGSRLSGFICDQEPSGFHPPLAPDEEISKEEFESMWERARQYGQ